VPLTRYWQRLYLNDSGILQRSIYAGNSAWSQRVAALAGTRRVAAGSDKLAPLRSRRPEIDHFISTPVLLSFQARNVGTHLFVVIFGGFERFEEHGVPKLQLIE